MSHAKMDAWNLWYNSKHNNGDCSDRPVVTRVINGRQTRSSATAEKQRVSCACLPRLAN